MEKNHKFVKIPGILSNITCGGSNEIWGLNSDSIFKFEKNVKSPWKKMPGGLTQISTASDGTVFGVNRKDEIVRWNQKKQTWDWRPFTKHRLSQISCGSKKHIWGCNNIKDVFYWKGRAFHKIPFGKCKIITVSKNGTIWGIGTDHVAYYYVRNKWNQFGTEKSLVSISISDNDVVRAITANGRILLADKSRNKWINVTKKFPNENGRRIIEISSFDDDNIVCLNDKGEIYMDVKGIHKFRADLEKFYGFKTKNNKPKKVVKSKIEESSDEDISVSIVEEENEKKLDINFGSIFKKLDPQKLLKGGLDTFSKFSDVLKNNRQDNGIAMQNELLRKQNEMLLQRVERYKIVNKPSESDGKKEESKVMISSNVMRYAFVIGNSEYDDEVAFPKLKSAINDAKTIAKLFESFGFEVFPKGDARYNCEGDDIHFEFDYFVQEIQKKLKLNTSKKELIVCFYFAGHGVTIQGDEVFLATDFKKKYFKIEVPEKELSNLKDLNERESFIQKCKEKAEKKVLGKCLTKGNVIYKLSLLKGKSALFLDCCRTKAPFALKLKRNMKEGGVICSYSTEVGQPAYDESTFTVDNHSPYTYSLLKRLKNGNGRLCDILLDVKNDVQKDTHNNQTPKSEIDCKIVWPV